MVSTLLNSRIAPVSEDLTTPDNRLKVIKGIETMNRRDYPLKAGEEFQLGEWAVLNATGQLEKAGANGVYNTYLLFSDTSRYDQVATGKLTVIQNSGIVAKTTVYDGKGTHTPGAGLTVKLVSGLSQLTAAGTDPVLARVVSDDGETLTFETVRS